MIFLCKHEPPVLLVMTVLTADKWAIIIRSTQSVTQIMSDLNPLTFQCSIQLEGDKLWSRVCVILATEEYYD